MISKAISTIFVFGTIITALELNVAHAAERASIPPLKKNKVTRFDTFETTQSKQLAMAPDGSKLFAINTPNGTLDIYSINAAILTLTASLPVGIEPIAVATLNNKEVWVANHQSDSVSIVDVSENPPRVIRTLSVGDAPVDIVFSSSNNKLAFITTASSTRGNVWVFDTEAVGSATGGNPISVLTIRGDTPQARIFNSGWKYGALNGAFYW